MRKILWKRMAVITTIIGAFFLLPPDKPFDEDAARKLALRRVLGVAPYKGACEEESFTIAKIPGLSDSPTFDFDFLPAKGSEDRCPAIPVSVNKETGEVWLLRM